MPGAVQQEEVFALKFLQLNAGADGVHLAGTVANIANPRAQALVDDMVATFEDPDAQKAHDADVKRAGEVNAARVKAGLQPMPFRMALQPGAESAPYHPTPASGQPLPSLDWRELQRLVDALKAAEAKGTAPAPASGHHETHDKGKGK